MDYLELDPELLTNVHKICYFKKIPNNLKLDRIKAQISIF